MLKYLCFLILFTLSCSSQENKSEIITGIADNTIKITNELTLKPKSHFYCEKAEPWPDVDCLPDYLNTDSISSKSENWTKEDLTIFFNEHRKFGLQNKCTSTIDSFNLDEIMAGDKFKVEISIEYYPDTFINKHVVVYGESGFAIISHGYEKAF